MNDVAILNEDSSQYLPIDHKWDRLAVTKLIQ